MYIIVMKKIRTETKVKVKVIFKKLKHNPTS